MRLRAPLALAVALACASESACLAREAGESDDAARVGTPDPPDPEAAELRKLPAKAGSAEGRRLYPAEMSDCRGTARRGPQGVQGPQGPQGAQGAGSDFQSASAFVTRSTNQAVGDGSLVAVSFSEEQYDVSGMWVVGQPTRLTATIAGKYQFNGYAEFVGAAGTGSRALILRKNGTIYNYVDSRDAEAVGGTSITIAGSYELDVDDYVELIATQTGGGGSVEVLGVADTTPSLTAAWAQP